MIQPVRHDWPAIIADIESAGVTHYKLALMMHRQMTWVDRVARGQEPKHYEGEMLLMIHAEYAPKMRRMAQKVTDASRGTSENEPSDSDKQMLRA